MEQRFYPIISDTFFKKLIYHFLIIFLPLNVNAQITGKALWRQHLGGQVIGLPSVQAGSVVVVSENGQVKAYSRQGNFLWDYTSNVKLSPFITRSPEGVNYVSTINGKLITINRVGRELWHVNLEEMLAGPVILGWDGRIFVPTQNKIHCYNTSGRLLWSKNLESPLMISPKEDKNGGIIMALENNKILKINPFGKILEIELSETPAIILSLFQKDDNEIPILVFYKNGTSQIIGGNYPKLPIFPEKVVGVVNGKDSLALTLKNGRVLLLSLNSGERIWEERSAINPQEQGENGHEAIMIYNDNGIYMFSRSGAAGFSEDGRRLWFIQIIGAVTIPVFSDEGLLYSGGSDWYLHAYRLEDRIIERESLYGTLPLGLYNLGIFPQRRDYNNHFSETELKFQFGLISKAIERGQVGEKEMEFTRYLMEVAGSVRYNTRLVMTHPPVQVSQRILAVRLLSLLGSKEIIPFLTDLFSYDPDVLVKSAVAEAIGLIGVDPDGIVLSAFLRMASQSKDERLLLAIAGATGSICRFSGPPVIAGGSAVFVALSGSDKPIRVRERALAEIRSLQFT